MKPVCPFLTAGTLTPPSGLVTPAGQANQATGASVACQGPTCAVWCQLGPKPENGACSVTVGAVNAANLHGLLSAVVIQLQSKGIIDPPIIPVQGG